MSNSSRQILNKMNRRAGKAKLGDLISRSGAIFPNGQILYVDGTNGVDGVNDAKTWENAFKTIAYAVSKASAYDAIMIGQGTYTITSAISLNKDGLKLIGCNSSMNQNNTLIYAATAINCINIIANEVEIAGIAFAHNGAADTIKLGSAAVAAVYKSHIHDCKFDGWGTALNAIDYHANTIDAPDIHIENCLFRSYADDVIISDYTRSMVNDCLIYVAANKSGISHVSTAGDRGDAVFAKNRIIGANSGDTGLELVGTPDAGKLIAYDNYFFNCATSITQAATNVAVQMNYKNDAAGGVLIDPIA